MESEQVGSEHWDPAALLKLHETGASMYVMIPKSMACPGAAILR